jgi:hypothetical protein
MSSMYTLDNSFAHGHFTVTVVGCGGTGSFVAEGLCRLLPPRADLVLVDHDRVEERNLIRQNFRRQELGQFKGEALARRLAKTYSRPVGYSTLPIAMTGVRYPGLIIGCVDNGPARRDIAERVSGKSLTWVGGYSEAVPREWQSGPRLTTLLWWVDAGNGESFGQVLVGNSTGFAERGGLILALPMPTIQRPDILTQASQRNCAEMAEQGPTINQAMAALVLETVRRLIEGTCSWMQLYLDLEAGALMSVPATPEVIGKMTKNLEAKN